ncbi:MULTISPECIES: hypothetical protein [unclassified Arthrobacter]|uniref:hypothetical protein n=1 Tax=unclassified Arthrobacter TaxID=235627 RepID=UPI001D15AB1C|nr:MULTISPECIES: hypothetical protein [unclassified Arthrobacter]MCC3275023.1 hypothetical protein [Arthrobacter sp. zg-Y20]MCC9177380.1 hypothetical protein [Arthrobacter sp. zg-Y750]MDK1315180.1 hypothetical protein [Arthrobacter sp. zg.Y20]WIB05018.1 hypothetical protein QNO06_10695 [Arthrobacter sp. zg-Y20]
MDSELQLADPQVSADFRNFVVRARAADDGAIRLQAVGGVLAAYVCVLRPRILGEDTPTVLGLRTMPLAAPAELDVTVQLAAVGDRLARLAGTATELQIPPVTVRETWAGITAPRSGWQPAGAVPLQLLEQTAHRGIREVAALLPASPGAAVVHSARTRVWSQPMGGTQVPVPAGAAFAALSLGFLPAGPEGQDGDAALFRNGRWLRLSTPRGHVLTRMPAVL